MKHCLTKMNLVDKYSFTPLPSVPIRPVLSINSARGVTQVLNDMKTFHTVYSERMRSLTDGYGFFLCFDDDPQHRLGRTLVRGSV
jgi:linoleate 10R-lipoxygenase